MSPGGRAGRLLAQQQIEQGLAHMVGLVHGVIADGTVSGEEAERLAEWTRAHPTIAARWPANLLTRRLEGIFRDGRMDARERRHLAALLAQLAGNPAGLGAGFTLATDLPVDRPEPDVVFEGRTFVFGGEMAYGPTHACEREAQDLGGSCDRAVTRRTDYLVIGALAAADWSQAEFGPLVDEAVQHRARGVPIAIITEECWTAALP
jgi:NAD-dependent DNA ligase